MVVFSIPRAEILIALTRSCHESNYKFKPHGQCKKFNGTIWKAIQCSLKSRQHPLTHWEDTLSDALHSIRSLLCTSTNCTPHERMFRHARRSVNGTSIPSWLKPGPRMDEKQPSRFVIFHLEVFVTSLHQVFPFPHPVMTIDLLTTAVRQMKMKWKILFLQTICLETTKVSLL